MALREELWPIEAVTAQAGQLFAAPPNAVMHALVLGANRREWVRGGVASAVGTVTNDAGPGGLSHKMAAGSNYLSLGYGLPAQTGFIAGVIFSAPSGSTFRGLVSATNDSGGGVGSRHEIFLDPSGQLGVSADAVYAASSSGARVDDGRMHCFIGGYDSAGRWACVDGALRTLGGGGGLAPGGALLTRVGALTDAGSPYSFGGDISLAFFAIGPGSRDWAIWASADPLSRLLRQQRIWVPAAAVGGSFSATGALSADAATISGSASHLTLHPSSGALSAGSATLAGTATHLTLHTATGALAADAATVAGSASLTSTGSFSATGSLSADVATLSGTATHYTLHTATGAIAADAATLAGTATHLTLHTATGALIADAASVSGVAVHSGDGAVIEVRNVGAGKSRRKSQRYVLAIDGKDVIVSDYAEAQALIDRAKEEAEAKAEEAQRRANASQRRPIGKVIRDARKALKAPSIEAPPELEDYARKVIADIQATYDQRLKDIEITALMRQRERQQEEDDEEVLMLIA